MSSACGRWFTFVYRTPTHHAVGSLGTWSYCDNLCLGFFPCRPSPYIVIIAQEVNFVNPLYHIFFIGFHSAQSLNFHTHGFWLTFITRTTERPCEKKVFVGVGLMRSTCDLSVRVAPPLPYNIILTYSYEFVNTFFNFFLFFKGSFFAICCVIPVLSP